MKYRQCLNDKDESKLIELYNIGHTQMFLSKKYNIYYRKVVEILKKNQVKIRTTRDRNKNVINNKQKILDLYLIELKNMEEIAKIIKTSKSSIYRFLSRNVGCEYLISRKKLLFDQKILTPHNKIIFTNKEEESIIRLYEKKLLSQKEIGKIFKCSYPVITKILKKYKINMNHSYRAKLLFKEGKITPWCKGKTKQDFPQLNRKTKIIFTKQQERDIIRLYDKELLSFIEVGKRLNVSSPLIARVLKENNIVTNLSNRRKRLFKVGKITSYIRTDIHRKRISEVCIRTRKGKTFEEIYGIEGANKMKEKMRLRVEGKNNPFYGKKHSDEMKRILSDKLKGRSYEDKFGKEEADKLKQRVANPLEKNGRWRGGISFEPYDKSFNNKFKKAIRKRDNYICLKCNKHQEREKRALSVHHIDYKKLNTLPQNCCSLCVKCHSEVNANRLHWTKFFQSLLSEKYGYEYSEQNEIILNLQESQ